MCTSKSIILKFLRCICYIFCFICFFFQMINVANQFQQEMTVTSVSLEKAQTKKLPLLTVCPNAVLKRPIYPLTVEEFDENIFKLEDLISKKSLDEFRNKSNWIIRTIDGPLIGNCYTFQYMKEVKSNDLSIILSFNRSFDFHLYIHNPGILKFLLILDSRIVVSCQLINKFKYFGNKFLLFFIS